MAGLTMLACASAASDDTASLPEKATERHVPVTVAVLMADHNTRAAANNLTSVATDFLVRSVRSDGDKGLIFEFGGALPSTVHLTKADFNSTDRYYRKTLADGTVVLAWRHEEPIEPGDPAGGLRDYRYVNVLGGYMGVLREPGRQFRLVYGRKTPRAGLPACSGAETCTARYRGVLGGEIYPAAERAADDRRQRIRGDLEITADFEAARLQGQATNITATQPGEYGPYSPWPTSRIDIRNGRIVDERFTATLTGVDNAATVDLSRSVAGFGGNLAGEFYGPAGEELGGVFTATRYLDGTDNDRIIEGHILGKKTAGGDATSHPRLDTSPISDGVNRYDWSTSPRIELYGADDTVNAVFADGKGSHFVSYTIDGVSHQMLITPEDLGRYSGYPDVHVTRRTGGREIWYSTRPYSGTYLNVAGFHPITYSSETSDTITHGAFGYVAFGDRTDAEAMPGGTATYSGKMEAREWQSRPESASSADAGYVHGSLALTANFDRGSLSGRMHSLQRRATLASSDSPVSEQLTLSSGRIVGNALSANLQGLGYSGSMKGAFYGPDADEVGGTLRGTKIGGGMLQGWFAGEKN